MTTTENRLSSSNKKTSILVADDDPDIRKILNFILSNNGFEVTEAIDGNDAFQKFLEKEVDIIISDVVMPGIDGLEFCQRVRGNEALKKVYFILLSAKGELNDKIAGFELGADEYMPKPFESLEVLARVKAGERIIKLQNMLEHDARFFEELAFTDELTKLYNRRFFKEVFNKEYAKAERHQCPLSVILIDVDHFKLFNDKYSHSTGDIVLQAIAGVLRKTVREGDVVARYGGEEFSILLPNTQRNSAVKLAERLRKAIEMTKVQTDYGELNVTISIGIGFLETDIVTPHEIFEQADTALLKAKQTGRNRICY